MTAAAASSNSRRRVPPPGWAAPELTPAADTSPNRSPSNKPPASETLNTSFRIRTRINNKCVTYVRNRLLSFLRIRRPTEAVQNPFERVEMKAYWSLGASWSVLLQLPIRSLILYRQYPKMVHQQIVNCSVITIIIVIVTHNRKIMLIYI